MSVAISIDKVVKKFGSTTVINGLSLQVEPGEFFTLLGPVRLRQDYPTQDDYRL
jgi:iron(III) transport system ATP-binding protein